MNTGAQLRVALVRLRFAFHVGTLDVADKGTQGDSYEGIGLSISRHPEAWIEIARLGGLPAWSADVRRLRIIDGHALTAKTNRAALMAWACSEELASPAEGWKVSWWDAVRDDEVCALFGSGAEAASEADEVGGVVTPVCGWAPTWTLRERMGQQAAIRGIEEIDQDVATVWAEDCGYDGIWWQDRLDPEALSAPRGVIFPAALSGVEWRSGDQVRRAEGRIAARRAAHAPSSISSISSGARP